MGIKLTTKPAFEPCPEFSGKACLVDVTPLKTVDTQYGTRDLFRFVFEVDLLRKDETRYCVWSKGFTPSYGKRSALRPFLKKLLGGHEMTDEEAGEFDMDSLIGKGYQITIVQETADNGQVYANIVSVKPDTNKDALKPSGKFVREKDRKQDDQGKRVPQVGGKAAAPAEDPEKIKVHVGRYKGVELRELSESQIMGLIEHVLPDLESKEKPLADDKRLITALKHYESKFSEKSDNDEDDGEGEI